MPLLSPLTGAVKEPVCSGAAGDRRDDYLMGRLAMDDLGALEELRAKYRKPLLRYLGKLIMTNSCRPIDLEHVAGLALDQVRSKAGSYTPRGRFRSWLYKIARNLLFDELKRAGREKRRIRHWHTTRYGSAGTRKRNVTSDDGDDSGWNTPQSYHASSGGEPVNNNSLVFDVNAWTRGVDITLSLSSKREYDLRKEIRAIFRRFGLVR
jgi:DNA-directed RNA polymerase specialized sigma24 family protein